MDYVKTLDCGEDSVFFQVGDREIVDSERALAILLLDEVVFSNSRDTTFKGEPCGHTVVLYVNCNDIFAWACADAENLKHSEIPDLYRMHAAHRMWGSAKWCCLKRQQRPQPPVERDMKKDGAWDDLMEALPPNTQDAETQAIFAAIKK